MPHLTALMIAGLTGCQTVDAPAPPFSVARDAARAHGAMISDGETFWIADVDQHAVSWWNPQRGWTSTSVGGEPARLARADDLLLVTLRAAGEVVALRRQQGELVELWRVAPHGAPFDVVTAPATGRAYVTLNSAHEVLELDLLTGTPQRRWHLGDMPLTMALVLGASGADALWVNHQLAGALSRIDLRSDAPPTRHPLTLPERFLGVSCDDRTFHARGTGDVVLAEDGQDAYAAVLYVDTWLHGPAPSPDSGPIFCEEDGAYVDSWRSSEPLLPGRFNPVMARFSADAPTEVERVLAVASATARGDAFAGLVRSYAGALVRVDDDDGRPTLLTAMEGADAVVEVDLDAPIHMPDDHRFGRARTSAARTAWGPDGLAVAPDGRSVWVWTWLDRGLEQWPLDEAHHLVTTDGPLQRVDGPPTPLNDQLLLGRRMFHTSVHPAMTFPGTGASCSMCHPDSWTDGQSYRVSHPPFRTNPISLAGPINDYPPLLWTGYAHDVHDEARRITSEFSLGSAMTDEIAYAIQAWVNTTPDIDPPAPRSADDVEAIARGRRLFFDPATGCAECHAGPRGKDGRQHDINAWSPTNTPSLRGLAATAPYLHHGRAPRLRDVLQLAVSGTMGNGADLTERDFADLEAYLLRFDGEPPGDN